MIKVSTKGQLRKIINSSVVDADLNHLDVSAIKDMSCLFYQSSFNGDISQWDVSNVTDMRCMFMESKFNGDISQWNVSNVTDMGYMFAYSKFNGDISKWDVSNVTNMIWMFYCSQFNGDISKWDVSNVIDMSYMFAGSKFNGDVSKWIHNKNTENPNGKVDSEPEKHDAINNPKHYQFEVKGIKVEVRDIMLTLSERMEGTYSSMFISDYIQMMQYVLRFYNKNGKEDLMKAQWYLDRLIESYEEKE